ncbi:MAG TPA: hypothetical protein VF275_05470 [Gammaproteobacteria bacterium]
MTINAFLEATKKATAGPVEVSKAICPEHQTETLAIFAHPNPSHCVEVLETGCKCGDEAMNEADAQFWVAARNAANEIGELRDLCRKITTRGQTVSEEDMERIREIVGG